MDQEDFTQCKYCGLKRRYILNHLAQNLDCKKHYTDEEILTLKISAKMKSDEKKKQRKRECYNPSKRAKRYQEHKQEIAKKYDSQKMKDNYNKFVSMKESKIGKTFQRIFDIFYDKEHKKMNERFYKIIKKKISRNEKASRAEIRKKAKAAVENHLQTIDMKRHRRDVCNKAFKNKIFKQTFQEIYKKAFDNAMDIIMNSNSCSEIMSENASLRNENWVNKRFRIVKNKELKKLSKQMMDDDLTTLINIEFQYLPDIE